MAKKIMYFKGAKFTAGGTTGYSPRLETTTKVKDSSLAEEICIEAGLAMSPTELLHAVRMVLEYTPRLVANDGRIREFSNLLTWKPSASGRLESPGGAWNSTCSAKVNVTLMKNAKQLIDANFQNTLAMPVPRLDNVTYIGAQSVTNVIKMNSAFAAYGRYMQFNAATGDKAYLINPATGGTRHQLTCTESDVAHATFNWPAGLTCEQGTRLIFEMTSKGASDYPTTNTKEVLVIASGETVIVESNDKTVKVTEFKDEDGGTYDGTIKFNKRMDVVGDGFYYEAPAGKHWTLSGAELHMDGTTNTYHFQMDYTDDKHFSMAFDGAVPPEAGTYQGSEMHITLMDMDTSETEILIVPIANLLVS